METSEDILREMRALGRLDEKSTDKIPRSLQALGLRTYANRLEAALKRKADSIHRAMVLIAGIEMEDSENPPRLWTALEDAYDALSDALGTDGETTADVEEAKATGRHFVVKPSNNAAKIREVLILCVDEICNRCRDLASAHGNHLPCLNGCELVRKAKAALAEPPRNCDAHTADELKVKFNSELASELPIANEHEKNLVAITAMGVIDTLFATAKEGGNDGNE